jgi:hypothetical protein
MDSMFHESFLGHEHYHVRSAAQWQAVSPRNYFIYVSSDKVGSSINEIDGNNPNHIMKMHPCFPELIAAFNFKEESDALPLYDLFYSIFINYMCIYSCFPFIFQLVRAMGEARALTQKAKCQHFDPLEEAEGSDNGGICAAWRQAAREVERETQQRQVHFVISLYFSHIVYYPT